MRYKRNTGKNNSQYMSYGENKQKDAVHKQDTLLDRSQRQGETQESKSDRHSEEAQGLKLAERISNNTSQDTETTSTRTSIHTCL